MALENLPFLTRDVPEGYGVDPRGKFRPNWYALARPNDEAELAQLLECARAEGIVLVPYGGGSGLVGGQIYQGEQKAICLSMEKFTLIKREGDSVLSGAGVVLDALHEALIGTGFTFPLSLASSGSAQIGGLIATNAGGVNVIRFGCMGALVLGVRAMLADGRVVDRSMNLPKDNTGYQLDRMMIGSEGTLGVITQARLKLVREDAQISTVLASVDTPEKAFDILNTLKEGAAPLHAFELISQVSWNIREEAGFEPTPIGAPAWSVLIDLAGEVAGFEPIVDQLGDAVVAETPARRNALWQMRETIPLANRKIGSIASHDIALPLDALPEFLRDTPKTLEKLGAPRINVFGHMGDGNLHYNLFANPNEPRDHYDAQALSFAIYEAVVKAGGSISAEHGVGRLKGEIMRALGQGEKLAIMRNVKAAFDPEGRLNPGVFE